MKNFSLVQLWDLRGELDGIINAREYEKIEGVISQYLKMFGNEEICSKVFSCYGYDFILEKERIKHNSLNFNAIYNNICSFERKYKNNEDVSVDLNLPNMSKFCAGDIWVLRAKYDKFLLDAKTKKDEQSKQQNFILASSIINRLNELSSKKELICYWDDFRCLNGVVKNAYRYFYCNGKSNLNCLSLIDGYDEK